MAPAPMPAATVVAVRPGPGDPEIFMLIRSARSPFMPGTLVFPGGRVDPEDGNSHDPETWERAARRECHEEAGLGVNDLRWIDTWITPSAESKRRYHARFFLATLGDGEGREAVADGHETEHGRWATAREHLGEWKRTEVDLPPPTLCTLLQMEARGLEALAALAAVDPAPPILPKVRLDGGQMLVLMPHDAEYDQTPGDAAVAPARSLVLPRRFVRQERVWTPCDTPFATG